MLKRVALVIGNSDYSAIPRLRNPANDARALAAFLQGTGFTLIGEMPLLNASRTRINEAAEQFARALGRDTVGLFYFSGHGLQLGGTNYLCPVEAGGVRETHVESELVSVANILQRTEMAQAALNIVILDACRNDPFQGRSFHSKSGFAPMQARTGTLLSFATQPGHIASDGAGSNSPFVEGLLAGLAEPGLDALIAFNKVGLLVKQATQGRQVPWMASSPIETRFSFVEAQVPDIGGDAIDDDDFGADVRLREPDDIVQPARTLAEQVAGAEQGATIILDVGEYPGRLVIDRPLTIRARRPSDEVVISGAVVVNQGPVTLENVRLEAPPGAHGIFISNGHLTVSNCIVTTRFDISEENMRTGIVVQGASASLDMRGGKIDGFPRGLWCEQGGKALVGRDAVVIGLDGIESVAETYTVGLTACNGTSIRTERGVTIEAFAIAALSGANAEIALSQVQLRASYTGVLAEGQQARAKVTQSRIENVQYGAAAEGGGRIEVEATDIDASVSAIYADNGGSIADVTDCPHLCGTGEASAIVHVLRGARAVIRASKAFGGQDCLKVEGASNVDADDCDFYDVSRSCVAVDELASATLSRSRIHHAANGVVVGGKAVVRDCQVHHLTRGVFASGIGRIEVASSWIYNNDYAAAAEGTGSLAIDDSRIVLNRRVGIGLVDDSTLAVSRTVLQQNGVYAVALEDRASAKALGCSYGGHVTQKPISSARTARWLDTLSSPRVAGCSSNFGSGGRSNAIMTEDVFYAPADRMTDELQSIMNGPILRDWSKQPPLTSADGRTVTYLLNRRRVVLTKLRFNMGLGGIRTALTGRRELANVTYEHRMEITVVRADATADFHQLSVRIAEEEFIDGDSQSDFDIGQSYSAPSVLCDEQTGCAMMMALAKRLMPTQ